VRTRVAVVCHRSAQRQGGVSGHDFDRHQHSLVNETQLTYTFLAGQPISFNERIAPWNTANRTAWYGFYAQDQWTAFVQFNGRFEF
jgi:hypothetical protein